MARPSKYEPEMLPRVMAAARLGGTDREIAELLGIDEATLYRWKHSHPEFCEALKVGKEAADERVVQSLYRKAVGYSFDAVKIFQYEGVPVEVPYVEHVPPSDTAAIFWLKNRRPQEWRDKVEHSHSADGDLAALLMKSRERAG